MILIGIVSVLMGVIIGFTLSMLVEKFIKKRANPSTETAHNPAIYKTASSVIASDPSNGGNNKSNNRPNNKK